MTSRADVARDRSVALSGHTSWVSAASRKRKLGDGADGSMAPITTKAELTLAPPVQRNNRLLAGYLAHEYLTKGTLLGRKCDPDRAEPAQTGNPVRIPEPVDPTAAYADVARLLKSDGAHISGIVNPTQLGRWLQM